MRYSETTRCFYPEWGNYGDDLPLDTVVVSDEDLPLAMQRTENQRVKIVNGRVTLESIPQDKELELLKRLAAIDEEVIEADKQPFSFNGNLYYPDTEFIQGIFSVLPYLPEGYTETWKTAEKEGIKNKKVVLNKVGIAGLALAYLQFKKNNWEAGEIKKEALKDAFLEEE